MIKLNVPRLQLLKDFERRYNCQLSPSYSHYWRRKRIIKIETLCTFFFLGGRTTILLLVGQFKQQNLISIWLIFHPTMTCIQNLLSFNSEGLKAPLKFIFDSETFWHIRNSPKYNKYPTWELFEKCTTGGDLIVYLVPLIRPSELTVNKLYSNHSNGWKFNHTFDHSDVKGWLVFIKHQSSTEIWGLLMQRNDTREYNFTIQ